VDEIRVIAYVQRRFLSSREHKDEKEEVVVKKLYCAMLATICTVAISAGFPPHSEAQSKKVVVQLAWVVAGLHAGFFVGYMEEDRMAFQIKLMSDLIKISPPKDVNTNQFINQKSVTVPPALEAELSKLQSK
jgi:hypothetical protein